VRVLVHAPALQRSSPTARLSSRRSVSPLFHELAQSPDDLAGSIPLVRSALPGWCAHARDSRSPKTRCAAFVSLPMAVKGLFNRRCAALQGRYQTDPGGHPDATSPARTIRAEEEHSTVLPGSRVGDKRQVRCARLESKTPAVCLVLSAQFFGRDAGSEANEHDRQCGDVYTVSRHWPSGKLTFGYRRRCRQRQRRRHRLDDVAAAGIWLRPRGRSFAKKAASAHVAGRRDQRLARRLAAWRNRHGGVGVIRRDQRSARSSRTRSCCGRRRLAGHRLIERVVAGAHGDRN
jgi:hypothetical protein